MHLHLLQQALVSCHDGSGNSVPVEEACRQLWATIPQAFRQYADPALASADFLRYHRGLVSLYSCALESGMAVVEDVGDLLRHHENLYGDLIPPDEPLPAFHVQALAREIRNGLGDILGRLMDKGVPENYLNEVEHACNSLFTDGKAPYPTYHHRHYLPDLKRMLQQLAEDPRNKDWPKRFVEALVNHNFNYMGFFNRWKKQLKDTVAHAVAQGRASEVLEAYRETVLLYHSLPGAFDPNRPSLKTLMESTLLHLQQSLSEQPVFPQALRTVCLAGDMAVRFRYRYKAGEFEYPTQQEAARDFVSVHISQSGQPVSPRTLTKFDKDALYGPALRYRRQLKDELRRLEAEFRLG